MDIDTAAKSPPKKNRSYSMSVDVCCCYRKHVRFLNSMSYLEGSGVIDPPESMVPHKVLANPNSTHGI